MYRLRDQKKLIKRSSAQYILYLWTNGQNSITPVTIYDCNSSQGLVVYMHNVSLQPQSLFDQIQDTGHTNKRRSKWISRLWRRKLRCPSPISCFVSRQITDMKISLSRPSLQPLHDGLHFSSALPPTTPTPLHTSSHLLPPSPKHTNHYSRSCFFTNK